MIFWGLPRLPHFPIYKIHNCWRHANMTKKPLYMYITVILLAFPSMITLIGIQFWAAININSGLSVLLFPNRNLFRTQKKIIRGQKLEFRTQKAENRVLESNFLATRLKLVIFDINKFCKNFCICPKYQIGDKKPYFNFHFFSGTLCTMILLIFKIIKKTNM